MATAVSSMSTICGRCARRVAPRRSTSAGRPTTCSCSTICSRCTGAVPSRERARCSSRWWRDGPEVAVLIEIASTKPGARDALAWSNHAWCRATGSDREADTSQARLHAMLTWLRERGAAAIPHAVGSFLDHLFGTWRILTAWRQPDDLRLCGLFHSVLATDMFERPLVGPDAIPELRALIGEVGSDQRSFE